MSAEGLDADVLPAERPPAVAGGGGAPDQRDLHRRKISTVVWATGYTRPYPWLRVPVLDAKGEIAHRRGVTPVTGLYVVGQRFQHRRDSNFLDGVRHDATFVADHIATSRGVPSQPITH